MSVEDSTIINSVRFKNSDITEKEAPFLVGVGKVTEGNLIVAKNGWKEALFEMSNDGLKDFIKGLQKIIDFRDETTEGNKTA